MMAFAFPIRKKSSVICYFLFTFNKSNSTNEIHKFEEKEEEGKENHMKHTDILKHYSYNFE